MSTSGQCWQLAVGASGQAEAWPARTAFVLATGGTLDFLRGHWQANRVLTDFRSGRSGSFTGVAAFTGNPAFPAGTSVAGLDLRGALGYEERGELRFGGHRGPASRSLLYLPAPDAAGSALVLFADGRPFYRLDLRSGSCQAKHPCGSDSYLVAVRVLRPDAYTEQWRVSGPGKDYEMTTTLARIGPAA